MSWIVTHTGREVCLKTFSEDDVDINDIAHALARINRFTGHAHRAYSVAEHCVHGCREILFQGFRNHVALEFLLHDAHEAYIGDMSGPLKSMCRDYRLIENRIERKVRSKFGVPEFMSGLCKSIDLRMLATEKRDLMPECESEWPCLAGHIPFMAPISREHLTPWHIEKLFLEMFNGLSS